MVFWHVGFAGGVASELDTSCCLQDTNSCMHACMHAVSRVCHASCWVAFPASFVFLACSFLLYLSSFFLLVSVLFIFFLYFSISFGFSSFNVFLFEFLAQCYPGFGTTVFGGAGGILKLAEKAEQWHWTISWIGQVALLVRTETWTNDHTQTKIAYMHTNQGIIR